MLVLLTPGPTTLAEAKLLGPGLQYDRTTPQTQSTPDAQQPESTIGTQLSRATAETMGMGSELQPSTEIEVSEIEVSIPEKRKKQQSPSGTGKS